MLIKLIELRFLSIFQRSAEHHASDSEGTNPRRGFGSRYFTTDCRDLHCGEAWCMLLK